MPEELDKLDKQTRDELVEYQNLQQQIQLLLLQRQQVLAAIAELEKAREEVDKSSGGFYRFIGSVLVPKKKEELKKELKEEKESLELRRDVFQKQEARLRERFEALRKKLEAKLGEGSESSREASKRTELS